MQIRPYAAYLTRTFVTEVYEMDSGDSLLGNVFRVHTEALYIARNKAVNDKSKHNVFTRKDIRYLVKSWLEVMALVDHMHTFYACLQAGEWYQPLLDEKVAGSSDGPHRGKVCTVQKPELEAETGLLYSTRALEITLGD